MTLERFKVIQGGERKKKWARRRPQDIEQICCRVCEIDIGVSSSIYMEAVIAPMEKGGKKFGGTKTLVCVHCLARGKVTRNL
jgi:hypothetical protein